MSDILTSLSALFATNYPYVPRTGNVSNNAPRPNDFADKLARDLKPGSTVTARTEYTVTANGALVPKSTSITVGSTAGADPLDKIDGKLSTGFYTAATPLPTISFGDLAKPRALLSPDEEASLFDADSIEGGLDGQARRFFDNAGAEDENGESVAVEIIAPDVADQELPTLQSQQQARVSSLYARNNDVIYNVEPAIAFAA